MKKYVASAAVVFLAGLMIAQPVNAAGGWKKIKDSSGIKVYERSVPGTQLMEYMGVTTMDAKMEVIGEVLRDVPAFRNWVADCYGAQIEKKYDRNTFVMYMVLRPPIIEERDIILKDKSVYDYENGKASIDFFCTDEVKIPLEKDRVRVTVMNGLFEMDYLGRNKTKFIYRLKVDPGGSIPKKVAYAVMKSYPYDTLKGLKKMLDNPKYAAAAKGTDEERQINVRANNETAVRKILGNRLMKFAKDKTALGAIIAADRDGIKSITGTNGSYASVEKATNDIYTRYIEKIIADKSVTDKMKGDKNMVAEITEMVTLDCGAADTLIDSIAEKYKSKYSK